MGISCEINLHTPPSGVFVGAAGNIVSGTIKYAVNEDTEFTLIVISLKGLGAISLEETVYVNGVIQRIRLCRRETYIDIDNVIKSEAKENITTIGAYEIPFKFEIPGNVPPSVKYDKQGRKCRVKCSIKYYVRIKFQRRGIMNFTKRFKKGIVLVSGIIPRLPTTPTIYGGQKKLTNLLVWNPNHVNIRVNVLNCVLKRGDKIDFHYELTNNTKLTINGVETKLAEVHKFFTKPGNAKVKEYDYIPGTDSKSASIKRGETQEMQVELNIPSFILGSAEFSMIYSREYCVFITIFLPLPHRNFILKIPIQIGNTIVEHCAQINSNDGYDYEPPTYWESMNEYQKDKVDLDEVETTENITGI